MTRSCRLCGARGRAAHAPDCAMRKSPRMKNDWLRVPAAAITDEVEAERRRDLLVDVVRRHQ